jgi:REP element-mobilizing transposase RayT
MGTPTTRIFALAIQVVGVPPNPAWVDVGERARQDSGMPRAGYRWRFITINTHCSWLPGDRRGFRNRDHRIDSTGDYKNPPPPEEHAGLRKSNQVHSEKLVEIPKHLRATIGRALIARLEKEGFRVLAVSVSYDHAHILVELPDNIARIRRIIGRCKRAACEAVKHKLAGKIWSAGGDWDPIDDREHQDNSYSYALTKQGPRAWTWYFKDSETQPRID